MTFLSRSGRNFALVVIALLTLARGRAEGPATYSVCSWNIENFGLASHHSKEGQVYYKMKPDEEIGAVISILKKLNPDVLGVNEIIQDPQNKYLQLFKSKLHEAGLEYPYMSTTQGEDPRIQNLLLSRFPIVEDAPLNQDTFDVTQRSRSTGEERTLKMRMERGIVNCAVQITPSYRLHVMLVHFKSRLPSPTIVSDNPHEYGDQVIRHNEAAILKAAIDREMAKDPQEKLIVMGDFNDGPKSKTMDTILDSKSPQHPVEELPLVDSLGDQWTHYYDFTDDYTRIDHQFVSHALQPEWVADKSFIYRKNAGDPPELDTYKASDHRPLYSVFSVK
jgi:endonuclease/exonuclease/phosphatase family metal-dependent hydrolase